MSYADARAYHELSAYTLGLGDPAFIHQHVVDAYAAQTATSADRPIRLSQALVGLYLHVEYGLTGQQVQRVHQLLANQRPDWPNFALPADRGPMRVSDVIAEPAGAERAGAIERWSASTWDACSIHRGPVAALLDSFGINTPR